VGLAFGNPTILPDAGVRTGEKSLSYFTGNFQAFTDNTGWVAYGVLCAVMGCYAFDSHFNNTRTL